MASFVKNVQTGPYAADEQEILRKQRLAEMLRQQSMEPIQAPQGGAFASPISPLQVAAKLAQGVVAHKQGEEADKKQRSLSERAQQERRAALEQALRQFQGASQPAPEMGGGPAMPPDPMGAAGTLMGAQDPSLQQFGGSLALEGMKRQLPPAPKAPEPFTLSPGASRFDPSGRQVANVPPTPPMPPAPAPFTLSPGARRFDAQGRQIAEVPPNPTSQGAGGTPYFTPVQTAKGIYAFDARTGKMELIQPGVVGSASDPNLQGEIAKKKGAGKVEGEATTERRFNMQGIGGIIQTAEDILNGTRREGGVTIPTNKPTGSGFGTGVDIAGGVFGISPPGSKEAQQLKALGGALTAKMPRMQGPQSDKDVALYKQMAAEVGDSTVPIERRKAALQTVKQLWAKYETLNPDAFEGGAGSWTSEKERRYQELLRKQSGAQ